MFSKEISLFDIPVDDTKIHEQNIFHHLIKHLKIGFLPLSRSLNGQTNNMKFFYAPKDPSSNNTNSLS